MISPAINFRVLLLAIVPTTAVSIIFFSYFVNKQIDDIENNIIDKGKSLATHLASASEYGIFSGNMSILSPLIEAAFENTDIVSVTITNNQGIPIIQKSKDDINQKETTTFSNTNNRVFSQPVIQHAVDIDDFEKDSDSIPPVIGWVVVEVSNESAIQHKQDTILQTLSITLLILISSIFLATRISRHITEPISSLTSAVNEIENGNLDVAIEAHSTGALLTLEKGVRSMLQSIKSSHWEAQNTIEKATKELRESLELLEHQNAELTIARQQALSSSQAKSTFLANISHEIRTPMNGILGFVKLLKNSNPTQEQTDYLYTIEQSANNLLGIINDILDLSKVEAGKLPLNNTAFNLEDCIEDVLSLTAPSAHDKGLEITSLFYDDTPRELLGAVDRVRQILINLIGNAIKFSDSGTIMLRIMRESQKDDAQLIKITISDQGPGISEKDKSLLFKSFSQIDESNTRQHGGTGLGLAISKSLAEAMNGGIGVESRKGEGSVFWFTFECQLAKETKYISENMNPPYLNKSIRLYDANELTQLSLSHDFRRQGFEITECLDLEDLCVSSNPPSIPDICVLSLNRHEATQPKTKEFLASPHKINNTKIFVIVSSSEPLLLKNLRKWGADACLSKPYRRADFEKILARLFNNETDPGPQKANSNNEVAFQTRLDGLEILIAEDNPINAKLVKTILQGAGASPTIVENGRKVISALKEKKFNVILMDIHMPEMNGIDAAREIRKTESPDERIAIIGLTAASKEKDDSLSKNTDFNEVLEKPIAVDELLHEIANYCHGHKPAKGHKYSNQNPKSALGINKDLSATLNAMLLRELPDRKEKLLTAYKSEDYRFLRSEVHRLLGGMAYCDFTELNDLTLQYQASLQACDNNMPVYFQAMLSEIDRLLETENA